MAGASGSRESRERPGRLRSDWCARGANVEFDTVWVGEHVSGVITHSPAAGNWLADRFAGRPAHANC
ncbi:lipase family protein [Streptomyces sp. NPDC054840]